MARIKKFDIDCDLGDGAMENFAKVWFDNWLTDMIAQGWRVLGSGDGFTFENEGQTDGSTGTGPGGGYHVHNTADPLMQDDRYRVPYAGNWTNISVFPNYYGASWVRLATPADAPHYMEFLFRHTYTTASGSAPYMEVLFVKDPGRFDSGATAWMWPYLASGAQAVRLREDTYLYEEGAPSQKLSVWCPAEGRLHYIIGDAIDDYDFLVWTHRKNPVVSGEVFMSFGRLRVVGGDKRSDGSDDPDPYVILSGFETSDSSTNHDWGTPTQGIFDVTINSNTPERFEDRVESAAATANAEFAVASYGLGDPGAGVLAGHYDVALKPAAHTSWYTRDLNRLTGSFENVPAAVVRDEGMLWFFKGYVKNDLVYFAPTNFDRPRIEELATGGGRRLAWGVLSVLWDDAQGPPSDI